jgi:hypothetical protein
MKHPIHDEKQNLYLGQPPASNQPATTIALGHLLRGSFMVNAAHRYSAQKRSNAERGPDDALVSLDV